MKPVLVVRHTAHVAAGYLQTMLEQRDIPFSLITIDTGMNLPSVIDDFSGLVLLGGIMSVNDQLDWIDTELALIRKARDVKLPVLGICLGAQLVAKALGAEVLTGQGKEIGWSRVEKTKTGNASPYLSALDDSFMAFQWHGDTFSIPEGAHHLLRNDCYKHQAFSMGNILALQFHPEMTGEMIRDWVQRSEPEIDSPCARSAEEILTGLDDKVKQLQQVAEKTMGPWFNLLN